MLHQIGESNNSPDGSTARQRMQPTKSTSPPLPFSPLREPLVKMPSRAGPQEHSTSASIIRNQSTSSSNSSSGHDGNCQQFDPGSHSDAPRRLADQQRQRYPSMQESDKSFQESENSQSPRSGGYEYPHSEAQMENGDAHYGAQHHHSQSPYQDYGNSEWVSAQSEVDGPGSPDISHLGDVVSSTDHQMFVPENRRPAKVLAPYKISKYSQRREGAIRCNFQASPGESVISRHPAQRPESVNNFRKHVQRLRAVSPTLRQRRFDPPSPEFERPPIEFAVGAGLRNSRFSGATDELDRYVSKKPVEKTRVEKVTKASLLKRGLREGQEETAVKRGIGVSDPENVEIVNLKESTDWSFQKIADYLNKKRVNEGRDPVLTMTGVNSRYNRTAPVLFESQGRVFIPLSQRRKENLHARRHGKARNPENLDNATWDEELDLKLVQIVRKYDADKWAVVKQQFEEQTGFNVEDRQQLAKRFNLL